MKKIKLFISDIDGTLTDGAFYYSSDGVAFKKFNTKDGMGFEILKSDGVKVALITGEIDPINSIRAKKIKVGYLYEGKSADGKLTVLKELCEKLNIDFCDVAYVGDDINCIKILNSVGYRACPQDASAKILKVEDILVLQKSGGNGAVREYIDYLIDANLI